MLVPTLLPVRILASEHARLRIAACLHAGSIYLVCLLSAFGEAHAQLMGYAAWPMRGRNGVHAGNGLIVAPNNSVAVVKYETGDGIYSSPAVGADGTVYFGSDDTYLYALNADGSLKWKYATGGWISSSPAVGADGTVYIGSGDSYLYALNADGSLKWKYETGGSIQSSPAVGADGTVYIGSDDSYLYALNTDGSLKWKYETGDSIQSSPAVGADGTVYIGSADSYLYALNTDGSLKWKYETGHWISSPAVGADGTVYIGSGDNHLHVIGLSAGHVTSSLHLAQRALARNQSALPQLQRLCNFSSVIHFVPSCNATIGCNVCGACCKDYISAGQCPACFKETCPPRTDTFTPETVNLVNASCQMLRNYNASAPYLKAWEGFVDPLSFTDYKGLISSGGTMMTILQSYETKLADFKKAEATVADRIASAQDAVKGYSADEGNWNGVSQRDMTTMSAYGKEITTLGQQMNAKYELVQGDVKSLLNTYQQKLAEKKQELATAKDDSERRSIFGFFSAAFHFVKAAVAICTDGDVAHAVGQLVDGVKDCINACKGCGSPCDKLIDQIKELDATAKEVEALAGMAKAAEALNAQMSTGAPLPQELPLLISDKIAMDSLHSATDFFAQELVKELGSGAKQFRSDIDDWTDMGVTRVSLFLSYYNLATRVQNDAGALKALQSRTSIVQDRLKDEQKKEAAIVTAALLVYERQQKQVPHQYSHRRHVTHLHVCRRLHV